MEEQSLAPATITAKASPRGRFGVGVGERFLLLLILGLAWLAPGLAQRRFLYGMAAWDAVLLLLWYLDLSRLSNPEALEVTRKWDSPASLSVESGVAITIYNGSRVDAFIKAIDDIPAELRSTPPVLDFELRRNCEQTVEYRIDPARRGDVQVGDVYLRVQSRARLAERWSLAKLRETVTVFPNIDQAKQQVMYLARSRQIELEKRRAQIRGLGREFQSLREYMPGDEMRDICWTATARRGKLVTKTYEVERSQAIWLVLDAGRLMRARVGRLSKTDYAANAALCVAEVALFSGDRVGLMAYGREPQVRVPLARGSAHLRELLRGLASIREEAAEADHFRAAGALGSLQGRRSLIIWITDLAETAVTPEVVESAASLARRHLVLFVVIGQPDLEAVAARTPDTATELYRSTAAQEISHRRELLLSKLRALGVLALQAESPKLPALLVNQYLGIKERNRI